MFVFKDRTYNRKLFVATFLSRWDPIGVYSFSDYCNRSMIY